MLSGKRAVKQTCMVTVMVRACWRLKGVSCGKSYEGGVHVPKSKMMRRILFSMQRGDGAKIPCYAGLRERRVGATRCSVNKNVP